MNKDINQLEGVKKFHYIPALVVNEESLSRATGVGNGVGTQINADSDDSIAPSKSFRSDKLSGRKYYRDAS
jgi:hypothetical protein